ncbi:hypothetical protein PAL_GLEAN10003449 [Pteropus alecto]|uniref:Uncharacterized protein n=1 Tax=Pteropus alecto TaxID=9402 RepID=L5KL46_PTEAL|nr:hypothetical protein PAL_GLEAN10003449 [Pteropus alecto]
MKGQSLNSQNPDVCDESHAILRVRLRNLPHLPTPAGPHSLQSRACLRFTPSFPGAWHRVSARGAHRGPVGDGTCPRPPCTGAAPPEALIILGLDEVAAEGDVGVNVIAVYRILTLALEEPRPHAVPRLQRQHHALALHDAAVAGLCVQDDGRLLVVHNVHVGLLEVPAVHVEAEEVEPAQGGDKVAGGQVEVPIRVDEDRIEEQRLEAFAAVQGRLAAHRKGREAHLARAARAARLPLGAFGALRTALTPGTLPAQLPRRAQQAPVPFVTCGNKKGRSEVGHPGLNQGGTYTCLQRALLGEGAAGTEHLLHTRHRLPERPSEDTMTIPL